MTDEGKRMKLARSRTNPERYAVPTGRCECEAPLTCKVSATPSMQFYHPTALLAGCAQSGRIRYGARREPRPSALERMHVRMRNLVCVCVCVSV